MSCCKKFSICPRGKTMEPLYSWVALVAVFFINFMLIATDVTYGIFYEYFAEKFSAERASIGWVFSIYESIGYGTSLFMTPFIENHGCRPVAMLGLGLYTVGFALSSFAPGVPFLIFSYGLIAGIGYGTTFLASSTVIQQRFKQNRGLANGIATLGYTVAAMVIPVYLKYFFRSYGLSGTLLLQGGLYCQAIVFAMLCKSPKVYTRRKSANVEMNGKTEIVASSDPPEETHDESNAAASSTPCLNGYQPLELQENKEPKTSVMKLKKDFATEGFWSSAPVFLGYPTGFPELTKGKTITAPSDDECSSTTSSSDENCFKKAMKAFKGYISNTFDITYLKDMPLFFFIMSYMLHKVAYIAMLAQTVGAGVHRGLNKERVLEILPIMGFCNLIIRLISTVLINFKWMNPVLYFIPGVLFLSCSSLIGIFADTYPMIIMTVGLIGCSEAICNTVLPMVLVRIVGVTRFPGALSMLRLMSLPGVLLIIPLSGWLVDLTDDYIITFSLVFSLTILAVITTVIVQLLLRRKQRNDQLQPTRDLENILEDELS